jgi:hypothetical protein
MGVFGRSRLVTSVKASPRASRVLRRLLMIPISLNVSAIAAVPRRQPGREGWLEPMADNVSV